MNDQLVFFNGLGHHGVAACSMRSRSNSFILLEHFLDISQNRVGSFILCPLEKIQFSRFKPELQGRHNSLYSTDQSPSWSGIQYRLACPCWYCTIPTDVGNVSRTFYDNFSSSYICSIHISSFHQYSIDFVAGLLLAQTMWLQVLHWGLM